MFDSFQQMSLSNIMIWADLVPISVFCFLGSFIEEVIAPIPSPVMMISAGLLASMQQAPFYFLFGYALLASFGKTLGGWVFYYLADKAEDWATSRWGRIFGLSHQEIEGLSRKLSQREHLDFVILFISRILPFIPTTAFSVACGLIKVKKKTFFWASLLGFWLRSLIMLVIGYFGFAERGVIADWLGRTESALFWAIGLIAVLALAWYYLYRQRKGKLTGNGV